MPTVDEFRTAIRAELHEAQQRGAPAVEINAGQLHRKLGGYPPPLGQHHQMPTCCDALYDEQKAGDRIVAKPPKGRGASLTIRYQLPR
jgi:5-methylcytosine-specific restriction protein A